MFGSFGNIFQNAGWSFKRSASEIKEEKTIAKSELIEIDNQDAAELIDSTHVNFTYMGVVDGFKNQAEKINEYRAMSQHPDVDMAIDDIICEWISAEDDEEPVQIDTSDIDLPENIKSAIDEAYEHVLSLLDFNHTAYEKVRQFYVDGRLAFHVVVDPNKTKEGIQKLVMFDPRSIKRVKEIKKETDPKTRVEKITSIDEYYIFDPEYAFDTTAMKEPVNQGVGTNLAGTTNFKRRQNKLKIPLDAVVHVHSGVLSAENNMILSHLEKAYKALNNLKMMEDALVVYRFTRAPERRVFYVDVGTLPKNSAEAYMQSVMAKYRTKITFDARSGKVVGDPHQIAMHEDYWLPRREGGKGTEIDTLAGGENLGQIDDVLYFKKNLYKSLNVPVGRLEQESTIVLGERTEISRDEWKFGKFIARLRRRFNGLFLELLKRELILKGITTLEDWENIIAPNIKFKYSSVAYQKEKEETETLMNQIGVYNDAKELEGKVFSRETLLSKIFNMTNEEQKEEQEKIRKEIEAKLYADPMQSDDDGGEGGF